MKKKTAKQNSDFVQLATGIGRKLFQQLGWVITVGFVLLVIDNFYLNKICKTVDKPNNQLCFFTPFIGNMGSNFLEIALIICFFEIGARREMLAEIQRIFSSTEVTKHVKEIHQRREKYSRIIEESFRGARPDQTIKLLGLFEDIHLLETVKASDIRDKICSGCHLQVLILSS